MNPKQQIAAAILACATARDGRGRWRHQVRLAEALGGSRIDERVAEAANRIGKFIAGFPLRPERSGARGGAGDSSLAPALDLSAGATPPRAGSLSATL